MKSLRIVLAVCIALGYASCKSNDSNRSSAAERASPLVGSWQLVAYERRTAAGEITLPLGPNPMGRLIYAADGRMAVQIMDPRRPSFRSNDFLRGEPDEIEQAFEGYFAYFGTYTTDVEACTVTHHVVGALYPNYVGRNEQRFFSLGVDRLTLKTPPRTVDGVQATFEVRWERER
jgi:hypothetical protein